MAEEHRASLRAEFERAAAAFAERTAGRFDQLDVVAFSRLRRGATVLEVGAGTGNFLALFQDVAGLLVGVDIARGMLEQARRRHPGLQLVLTDGAWLPLASGSVDLAASAQALHHMPDALPVLRELGRVAGSRGRVLVVDQVASEAPEEAAAMHELEVLRDPSHAATRPPSELRRLLAAAGLRLLDERLTEQEQRLSGWMWPGEFPPERIDAVRELIARRGGETGMGVRDVGGGDYAFTRRRVMLLAEAEG